MGVLAQYSSSIAITEVSPRTRDQLRSQSSRAARDTKTYNILDSHHMGSNIMKRRRLRASQKVAGLQVLRLAAEMGSDGNGAAAGRRVHQSQWRTRPAPRPRLKLSSDTLPCAVAVRVDAAHSRQHYADGEPQCADSDLSTSRPRMCRWTHRPA